jgi:hypothetical protein
MAGSEMARERAKEQSRRKMEIDMKGIGFKIIFTGSNIIILIFFKNHNKNHMLLFN